MMQFQLHSMLAACCGTYCKDKPSIRLYLVHYHKLEESYYRASNKRYNACFSLPELNAYHLGELLYMLAMSVAYEGELADVDAFNQPGVESYKRIMGPKLQALKAAKAAK